MPEKRDKAERKRAGITGKQNRQHQKAAEPGKKIMASVPKEKPKGGRSTVKTSKAASRSKKPTDGIKKYSAAKSGPQKKTPVGYFSLDPQGKIISVNQTGADMLGESRRKLNGKKFAFYLHFKDRDKFHLHVRNVIRENSNKKVDLRLKPQKFTEREYIRLDSLAVADEDSGVQEIRTTVSNITKIKIAEAKLTEKTPLVQSIIDHTDAMMAYLDPDYNIIWVNQPFIKYCGMDVQNIVGRNHFDVFPDAGNESVFRQVRSSGEAAFYKDKPLKYKDLSDGAQGYWDLSLVPVKDNSGLVTGLVLSLRDTTQYKLAQLKLTESEERFRIMAETSIDIIFQINPGGRIDYVSPAVSRLGYSQGDVIGGSMNDFIVPEDVPKAEAALKQILEGKKIKLFELRLLKSDSTADYYEINASPNFREGMIMGVQGIARNFTERKLAEEKLRQIARFPSENPFPVMRISPEGVILYANAASGSLLNSWETNVGDLLPKDILRHVKDTIESNTIREIERSCGETVLSLTLVPIFGGEFINIYGFDITSRDYAENKIQRQNEVLAGMNKIFQTGMSCETDEELAEETLNVLEQITESKFGFIGEIGQNNLLHDIAISDPGWQQCTMADKIGHRTPPGNFRIAGLYGKVLIDGKPLLVNDPAAHAASIGTPDGHPAIKAFLGVPLVYGGKTIGLIALANRPGGFQHDEIDVVKALSSAFVESLFKCRAERALQESSARERRNAIQLKKFVDFCPIPIWIAHDAECKNITGNIAAAELIGVDTATNVSQSIELEKKRVKILHVKDGMELAPEEMPLQYAVKQAATVKDVALDFVLPDGRVRSMLGAATPVFDEVGQIRGGIAAYIDITLQKTAEQDIKNLNRELQGSLAQLELVNTILKRSNEDLQHFASIVSHDLQEPLRTVSSFVQLIAQRYHDNLDEKGRVFMQHIISGTEHMQRLLNDLLSYSRVGGGELKREKVSLGKVLKDIKQKLDRKIKENRAEITGDVLPDVYGDAIQLFTLLQNLISNGLKYRSDKSPRIMVSARQDEEKNEWTVCVQDNGIGFEPRHAEQIFLIFQRLHLRDEYEGTGIGLAICKKIVERHGGRIWAESEPGRGSSFYFTLPKANGDLYD